MESEQNPADLATRGVPPDKLMESSWLESPEFLKKPESTPQTDEMFTLSTKDPEVRKGVLSTKVTTDKAKGKGLGAPRFKRFSSLKSLQQAVARLIVVVREFKRRREPKTEAIESEDGRVRKANVEIARDGEKKVYLRPIKELTLLLPNNGTDDADPSPA